MLFLQLHLLIVTTDGPFLFRANPTIAAWLRLKCHPATRIQPWLRAAIIRNYWFLW